MLAGHAGTAAAQTAVPIGWSTTYQWIDGFGAAQPGGQHYCANNYQQPCTCDTFLGQNCNAVAECGGAACYDVKQDFATALRSTVWPYNEQVMDQLFSPLSGIGLSVLRMKVSPVIEPSLNTFSPASDAAQGWIMQQAQARGPVKIMASVWSPPGWMKTNNSTIGGFCSGSGLACVMNHVDYQSDDWKTVPGQRCALGEVCLSASVALNHYQHFADLLYYFATQYAAFWGITIYALSFTNEPDNHAVYWDTASWTGSSIATFLKQHIALTFAVPYNSSPVTTKIIAPESSNWNWVDYQIPWTCPPPDGCAPVGGQVQGEPIWNLSPTPYLTPSYSEPIAKARIDVAAAHPYDGDIWRGFSTMLSPTTHVWQTESSMPDSCGGGSTCCAAVNKVCTNAPAMPIVTQKLVEIHEGLTGTPRTGPPAPTPSWISAWIWFKMYDWQTSLAGLVGNTAMPQNTSSASIFRTKFYWATGNFSKFVRPGFVRIAAPAQPTTGVFVSAYKEPNLDDAGPLVIVVINSNSTAKNLLFQGVNVNATPYRTSATENLKPLTETYLGWAQSVPAYSVVTYVANSPRRSADLLFRDASGRTMAWLSELSSSASYPSYPGSLASDWQYSGGGEFDGDGYGDLVWRRSSNGDVSIWHNKPTAEWSTVTTGSKPTNWQIKGVGDFDKNGKSDILWYNPIDGSVKYWKNGLSSMETSLGVATGSELVGVGDFNADGYSDVLFRGVGHTSTAIWLVNSSGTTTVFFPLPDTNWTVQGVGEFDNNGKSDIVWRSSADGSTAIWHDGTSTATYPGGLGANWQMQAVGDFDGNSISDFLWRDNTGLLAVWQNGASSWTKYLGNPGGTWQVLGAARIDQ